MTNFIAASAISLVLFFSSHASAAQQAPEGMVEIQAGCFQMGTDKLFYYETNRKGNREQPAHKVCLDSFYLDSTEVPQKKWDSLMDFNNSVYKGPDLPITHIDWHEARTYCKRLGKRLPTEAEWEYAARAGSTADNPWGNKMDRQYVWYGANSGRKPHPVATRKANAWGLHDMMGSVWEWVSDWYQDDYYKTSPVNNPQGPKERQSWRVIRGGSWLDDKEMIRVTVRYRGETDMTEDYWVGFRCAADLKN